jgi:ankyrin repeat protein
MSSEALELAYNQWMDIVSRTNWHDNISEGIDPNAIFPDRQTALHLAAQFDYVELAEWLLSNNAEIDLKDIEGYTPLLQAAVFLSYSVIKLLLVRGADPKHCTNSGLDLADLLRIGVEIQISLGSGVS